jgi:aldehyde:ferredoxin oxidoreductase
MGEISVQARLVRLPKNYKIGIGRYTMTHAIRSRLLIDEQVNQLRIPLLMSFLGYKLRELEYSKSNETWLSLKLKSVISGYQDMFLGGRGTATKQFWDQVSPEVTAFSSDNRMIFSAGLLTGTPAPGANRTILTTLSPQTGLLTYSSLGGYWGAELKHAGYDNLIITGKSSKPVYLWIDDGKLELRDATHLWGKDVHETIHAVQVEVHQPKAQVLCIGPAGENLVRAASIEHGSGAGASRAGVGAVMGDKNLKAIAICGTKDIYIAQPAAFMELCHYILDKTDKIRDYFDRMSYEAHDWFMNNWAWGNMGARRPFRNAGKHHEDFAKKFQSRRRSCNNCVLACKVNVSLPNGEYCAIKCQSWFCFMFAIKSTDFGFNARCINLCEKYGLDAVSTACNIAFAIDLFEKGILTRNDTEGLELEWKNQDLAFTLIAKIAFREGIGDVLADGVHDAAQKIGRGAHKHAYHIKKLEMIAFPLYNPYRALRTSITDRLDMTRAENSAVLWAMENSPAWKADYVRAGYFHYPKEFEKPFIEEYIGLPKDYDKIIPFTSHDVDTNALADSTGICIFWTGFWLYPPISVEDQLNLISTATGRAMDMPTAMKIAKRINALTRAYNVRKGIRRKDDFKIPQRFFEETPAPPDLKLDADKFKNMISSYYKVRGWNDTGVPSREELERLELHDVYQDLAKRGIL